MRTEQLGASVAQLEALLDERAFEPLHAVLYAPTHFRLAGLSAEAGDSEGAARHYGAFLEAFNDPDPDFLWMVEEARIGVGAS